MSEAALVRLVAATAFVRCCPGHGGHLHVYCRLVVVPVPTDPNAYLFTLI